MMIECSIAAIGAIVLSVFFIRPKDVPPAERFSAAAHLEERKSAIHEGLRDLQFDFRTGKLSEIDYQTGKLLLQSELAAVLVQIRDAAGEPGTSCGSCGAEFKTRLKFCGNCGKAVL